MLKNSNRQPPFSRFPWSHTFSGFLVVTSLECFFAEYRGRSNVVVVVHFIEVLNCIIKVCVLLKSVTLILVVECIFSILHACNKFVQEWSQI